MISKKLLDELLSVNATKIKLHPTIPTLVQFFDKHWKSTDVFSLAYQCKVWAFNKGYIVSSGINSERRWWADFVTIEEFPDIYGTYVEDSESEAIFKACEWILKEKQ